MKRAELNANFHPVSATRPMASRAKTPVECWHAVHEALLRERGKNSELELRLTGMQKESETTVAKLEFRLTDMQKEREKTVAVMRDLTTELQAVRGREFELQKKVGKLQQEREESGRELEMVTLRSEMLQDGITEANQEMCDLREQKEELEKRVAFLEGQPAQAQATAEMIKRWLAEQMSEKRKSEVQVLEAKHKEAMDKISALEMERDVLVGVIGASGQNCVNALTHHESRIVVKEALCGGNIF